MNARFPDVAIMHLKLPKKTVPATYFKSELSDHAGTYLQCCDELKQRLIILVSITELTAYIAKSSLVFLNTVINVK